MKTTTLHWKRMVLPVLLVLLLSAVGLTNAMAQTFTVGNLNYSLNDDGVSVTVIGHVDGSNATGELVIPESVNYYSATYTVTIIADNAFSGCSGLTGSLIIPETITSIGANAFNGCSGFTGDLTIPNSVTYIGTSAFSSCSGFIGALTIGTSLSKTGRTVFSNCNFTTLNYNAVSCYLMDVHVYIGALISIYEGSWNGSFWYNQYSSYYHWLSGCNSFVNLNIGDGVTKLPYCFLDGCSSFTGNLVIPESVTTIEWNAFNGCSGFIGSLTIPQSVTTLDNNAFANCNGFTALNFNAANCTSMSSSWLENVTSLTSLSIGENVQRIPDEFVTGKSSILGSLTIPNSVFYIGANAFSSCSGLTGTLTLGQSVSQIGNSAFFDACAGFTFFNVLAETPPTLGNNVFISADYGMPVSVPCGSLNAYQNADGWNVFTNIQEPTPCMWDITAIADPTEGGTVSGAGTYEQGQTCTLTATPNEGYEFINWKENGQEVSSDATFSFNVMGNRTLVASFSVPVDPVGTVRAEYYPDMMNPGSPYVKVVWGNAVEELFETGDFSQYDWQVDPYYPWTITTTNPYEGQYCMKSGGAGVAYVVSNMTVTLNIPADGEMSFFCRISSENGYDYGYFYIDGQQMANYTSAGSWCEQTFPITAGDHTFQWRYTKDGSVDSNDDCFYVDYITFYRRPEYMNTGWHTYLEGEFNDALRSNQTNNPSFGYHYPSNITNQYDGFTLTKVSLFSDDFYGAVGGSYTVNIYVGGSVPGEGTLVSSQQVELPVGLGQWVDWDLNTPVNVNGGQDLWVIYYVNQAGGMGYPVGMCNNDNNPNGDWWDGGSGWEHYGNGVWTMRNYFTDSNGRTIALVDAQSVPFAIESPILINNHLRTFAKGEVDNTKERINPSTTEKTKASVNNTRENIHFRVYRTDCDGNDYSLIADNVSRTIYVDYSWLQLPLGSYQYGVSVVDEDGVEGEIIASNCIDRDLYTYEITATPNYEERGTVIGMGEYALGAECTLTATPFGSNVFARWTENGTEVSTDATYSFIVTEPRNLVAVFYVSPNENIVFADLNVKAICVNHWDTDGDGELTYAEAAAVTNLGGAFSSNQNITSFDELQYFTGLTFIGDYEFYYCTNLTSIVIPENVTSIGYQAFLECYNLGGTLTIGENVNYIGWGAFINTNFSAIHYNTVNCEMGGQWLDGATSSLTSLTIGENVQVIPYEAFQDCYNINGNLIIPNSVTYIGSNAFYNCSSLTSITIPEGITSIEEGVFDWCSSLETINLPNSIETIGDWAFNGCTSLTNLVLPSSLTSIGYEAFSDCHSLTGMLEIPAMVTSIGDEAFEGCYGLTGLILSDNIQSVGYYAFKNCSGLRGELTLPESLESVGGYAFYGCDGISTVNYNATNCQTMGSAGEPVFYDCAFEHIRIGENVQSIPNYAFKHCFLVKDIASAAVNPPTIYSSTFGMVSRNIPVSVPMGSGEAYRTAPYWEEFFHITEDYSPNSYTYHWNVNVNQFASNMTVTGIIQIEGVEQAVPHLEIGAFCNGECRGRQLLTYYPQVDRYLVFLMLYGEDGDVFTFRLYDHEAGEELTAGCASVITFETDAIVGSFLDPYVFNFTDMQLTQFSEGWNWWSTYVEQAGIDGLSLLQESLGDNGVAIRSQASGYTDYYEGYGWYGSLESINNESSYRVVTSAPCVAAMPGNVAIPSQHPITLSQGWTWIGYLPSRAMDINAALEGLEATQGDMVKSQQGYSDYYPGYGWFGSLNTVEPGMGLMYYSTNGETVTFTYPDNTRNGELKQNLTAENNHWKPNTFAYPDNMTVMATIEFDGEELNSDHYELAAFAANGECRGSVKLTYAEPINRHVAFLTISGKDAAELSFRLYDTETGMEYYDAEESLDFVTNAIVGMADDLYTIHFRGTTGIDEFANRVKVYPNPVGVGEQFSIGLSVEDAGKVHVEIVNTLGVVETLRATSVQLPFQLIAPTTAGVYTLRITVEGKGTVVQKLVVK